MLSLSQCVMTACLLEATAAKPGNVHRGADFDDLTYPDFLLAAQVIAGPLTDPTLSFGAAVHAAVAATQAMTGTNVNLGIILLLAPVCRIPREQPWRAGLANVWRQLTPADTALVYDAIRLAAPGGLGQVEQGDVAQSPPDDLLIAMRWAAARDTIARQYVNDYDELERIVLPALERNLAARPTLSAIVRAFVETLAALPDTLILRKSGELIAGQASDWAADVLIAAEESDEAYYHALADLDFWLRSDGRRRNPGTTADLICAALFLLLRDGKLQPPFRWE